MWQYSPKDASECLDAGAYDAILFSVTERNSKAGNPMLEVIWTIPFGGRDWLVRDYIVQPKGLFKLKRIAKAWHQEREFDEQRFDMTEHVGDQIILNLDVQTSAQYGDQNNVVGYAQSSGQIPPRPVAAATIPTPPPPPSGDIPF